LKILVKHVIEAMEKLAPLSLSKDWDNSGLQIGHPGWSAEKIMVALDPLPEAVAFACEHHMNMLVTHHPLIFKPLKSIDTNTPIGKIIHRALHQELAIFSAHTNLDTAKNGVNDVLAQKIGLQEITPLIRKDQALSGSPEGLSFSFGRTGVLGRVTSLVQLAGTIKRKLSLEKIEVAGSPDLLIERVATCCGSGSGLMELFLSSGAQVFISGDLKYHDARDAEAMGVGLMDIGHFASEHLMIEVLVNAIKNELAKKGLYAEVQAYCFEKDPFYTC
jgi:GTP cyclohydrolase I